MIRSFVCSLATLSASTALFAAEMSVDLGAYGEGDRPTNFVAKLTGSGPAPDWRIVLDDTPTAVQTLSPFAPQTNLRPVIGQFDRNPTDERFPLYIFQDAEFDDFTLTTRVKMVEGEVAQMAGIAFRIQDENNYYVVRASASGDTFMFYTFKDGLRTPPIGNRIEIEAGVWNELKIVCRGSELRFYWNGEEAIPPLNDPTYRNGRIGYWTKSDSVSHFVDTRITYRPQISFAQELVTQALDQYDRLRGLKLVRLNDAGDGVEIIGSDNKEELGEPGLKEEDRVIVTRKYRVTKGGSDVTVTLPLTDRNGDVVAAARVVMESFPGQTEQNAIARAVPVARFIAERIVTFDQLDE